MQCTLGAKQTFFIGVSAVASGDRIDLSNGRKSAIQVAAVLDTIGRDGAHGILVAIDAGPALASLHTTKRQMRAVTTYQQKPPCTYLCQLRTNGEHAQQRNDVHNGAPQPRDRPRQHL